TAKALVMVIRPSSAGGSGSALVPFVERVADGIGHDLWQAFGQTVELELDPVQAVLNPIQSIFDAIEPGLDGRQIVAVTARLLEDMASDHLFAFDLAREHAEFISGHFGRHCAPPCQTDPIMNS